MKRRIGEIAEVKDCRAVLPLNDGNVASIYCTNIASRDDDTMAIKNPKHHRQMHSSTELTAELCQELDMLSKDINFISGADKKNHQHDQGNEISWHQFKYNAADEINIEDDIAGLDDSGGDEIVYCPKSPPRSHLMKSFPTSAVNEEHLINEVVDQDLSLANSPDSSEEEEYEIITFTARKNYQQNTEQVGHTSLSNDGGINAVACVDPEEDRQYEPARSLIFDLSTGEWL